MVAVIRMSRLVLLLFMVAQAYDGLFTYIAVRALGPDVEGNFILATWMVLVGPAPTLLVAKGVAAAAGALVYWRGLHGVLAGMTALYACVAIIPWLFVYRTWP